MTLSSEPAVEAARLSVRNIGGIDQTTVELGPGVTVLEGRNATNRTSLLQAIMAGCGCESVAMKADADSASVSLTIDGETYERTLRRENGGVTASGDAYLDDLEAADLFAFLLESNEARRAVARGDELRELIMRPVDTGAIRREIRQAEERKRAVDTRLEELEELEHERPALERRRDELTAEIEETETTLAEVEEEIDSASAEVADEREQERETEQKLAKLRKLRATLDDVRYERETERESLENLREERETLRAELDELAAPDEADLAEIRRELDDLREERTRLDRKIGELDTVVQFNREMLDGSRDEVRDALDCESPSAGDSLSAIESLSDTEASTTEEGEDAGETTPDDASTANDSLTDRLVDDTESVTCWTCGSSVETDEVEQTVELLRELRGRTADEKDEVQAEISRLEERKTELEEQQQRHTEVVRRLDRIEEEVAEGEGALESLEERRAAVEAEIEEIERAVEALRDESRSELLSLHERANELERELGRLSNERDAVEDELEEIRAGLDGREKLEAEREELQSQLVELRTRIGRVQEDAVEAFNDHMETVLGLLGYDNLERIWIERTQADTRNATDASFELHIVRNTAGTVYEDSVNHLSESEREVVGLVFALAGYLAHDVHQQCPFVLLDSLEAIDSERIAALVDYFEAYSDYLVVALLPEDAAAVDSEYDRLTEI
ncbi:MAG: archaea-specific SMC-related protein [Halolamina sp.]|uniref:archaea-specific SMC-related protein n=1 Tax=Halolamina sp. TaxID=1940283 RepID=UPI002FC3A317